MLCFIIYGVYLHESMISMLPSHLHRGEFEGLGYIQMGENTWVHITSWFHVTFMVLLKCLFNKNDQIKIIRTCLTFGVGLVDFINQRTKIEQNLIYKGCVLALTRIIINFALLPL